MANVLCMFVMSSTNLNRPACAEDWEPYRESITDIYSQNTLAHTMDEMKASYNFSATAKQYKNKIKEWGLDNKYVKDYEYERLLQLPAQNEYIVRDKVVTHQDLARYRRRKEKNHKKNAQSGNASSSNAGEGSSSGAGGSYAGQYIDYSGAEDATHYTTAGGGMSDYGSGYVYDPTGMVQEGDYTEADSQPYPGDYDASGTSWNF
ncbi:hypothetical protein F503_05677 [Ophiostoma piceae UAMH 11346]|uniref:Clr5 domain-containing protein n=1 Tax=Ophiostoma piceae (strain UAMH 11346) TaxID=1262450 RepID=S3CCC6_OPHP1|nr:hypothetical protein F503_05677 [Ophiostoma piceae UAMH 11346]